MTVPATSVAAQHVAAPGTGVPNVGGVVADAHTVSRFGRRFPEGVTFSGVGRRRVVLVDRAAAAAPAAAVAAPAAAVAEPTKDEAAELAAVDRLDAEDEAV